MSAVADPVLVIFDFDRTLCATPRRAPRRGLQAWMEMVAAEDFDPPPIVGAYEGAQWLLRKHKLASIITARTENLREKTVAWLKRHMPALLALPLSMRSNEEKPLVSNAASKIMRIYDIRKRLDEGLTSPTRVILIDDDYAMATFKRKGDEFMLAPAAWQTIAVRMKEESTIVDQPAPPPMDTTKPCLWDLVIEEAPKILCVADCSQILKDMRERDEIGRARYSTPLQPHNGRNAMVDAYQETLDQVVYLRQAAWECNDEEEKKMLTWLYEDSVLFALRVRRAISS